MLKLIDSSFVISEKVSVCKNQVNDTLITAFSMLSFKTLEIWEDNITCMMKGLSFITNQFEFLKIDILGTIFCNAVYIYRQKD